jgi:hypothetical protein
MEFRYTRTDFDSAFFLTYHFQQLVPSDWGISDYPHEVWMRFTIGGDDTIMFAEVIPYPPLEYMGYDADSGRGKNASLALEIMPFQDLTGNVFSQFIATIKRNLANITFYDTDTVDRTQIETLQTKTAQQVNGLNFVGVSGLQLARSGDSDLRQAFTQINFGQADTNQILLGVNTTINLLERVLGMSAQEVGSSASHQQSKKEVEITNSSSSNRLAYTASFIDEGIDAWKRHLVEAAIEYMDGGDVEVSIPVNDFPDLEANLESIGFKFAKNPPVAGQPKVAITGKLSKAKHLNLIQIVANRSDAVRQNDMQVGQLMMQTIQSIANSPLLSQVVAPESLVEMLEYSARLAGADDDFRIKLNNQAMLANALQGVVQKIQQEIMGAVEKEVVQPIAQEMAQMKQGDAQNMQQVAQEVAQLQKNMQQIMQMLAQAGAPGVQPQPQPGPPLPPQLPPTPPQQPIPAPQPQTFAPPAEPGPAATSAIPNSLIAANPQHREIAKQFLVKAKGRKKRARELAAQAGYKM